LSNIHRLRQSSFLARHNQFDCVAGGGAGPAQFVLPHAIALGPDGRIHVCDRYNWRIQIFDGEGNLKDTWSGFVPAGQMLHKLLRNPAK
jgi:hypothetical protein